MRIHVGLALLLGLWCAPAFTQVPWQALYDSSKASFAREDYPATVRLMERALPGAEAAHRTNPAADTTLAYTLHLLGDGVWWMGDNPRAERLFRQYLDLIRARLGEESGPYASRLGDLGTLCYGDGRYREADSLLRRSIQIYSTLGQERDENFNALLINLAVTNDALGLAERAETIYRDLLTRYRSGQLAPDGNYVSVLNNYAALCHSLGRYAEALPLFEESLELRRRKVGERHPTYAQGLHNLGALYLATDRLPQAEDALTKALLIQRRTPEGERNLLYLSTLSALGHLRLKQHRYGPALDSIQKALRLRQAVLPADHPDWLNTLSLLGGVYARTGQLHRADSVFAHLVEGRQRTDAVITPNYAEALNNRAATRASLGDLVGAEGFARQAQHLYHRQIAAYFRGLSEREQSQYLRNVGSFLESYNSLAATAPTAVSVGWMLDNQLLTKGLLLTAARGTRQAVEGSRDSLLARQFGAWQQLREALARYYALPRAELARRKVRLDSLEAAANTLEKDISIRSARFARNAVRPTWQAVRARLQPGEATLEVLRFRRYEFALGGHFTDTVFYAGLVVRPEWPQPRLVLLKNGNALEDGLLAAYRDALAQFRPTTDAYTAYWQPFEKELAGVKKLYFAPDGVYNLLNPATLRHPRTGRYLLDEYALVRLTSCRDLLQTPGLPKEKPMGEALLLGFPDYAAGTAPTNDLSSPATRRAYGTRRGGPSTEPLPHTKAEVEEIGKRLAQRGIPVRVLTGSQASEEAVKAADRPRLLHLATHGYFDPAPKGNEPTMLRAGLVLAGAGRSLRDSLAADPLATAENGLLTAYEAQNLRLEGTDLVVLSACETALGDVRPGEGVYGLQRAFQVAGARSLLMSLWQVDDAATHLLMTTFYEDYLRTGNKAAAFRLAQQRLRQSREFSEPQFWGAFVLVGE